MPEVGVNVTVKGRATIIALTGDLDMVTAMTCGARLRTALDGHALESILVIDLRALGYCGVKGVRMVRAFVATCAQRDVTVRLVAAPGSMIRRVLRLLQLQDELPMVEDLDRAIVDAG